MKKILAIFVMVLFAAYPAVSQASSGHDEPVQISGVMVLQHIISSDVYDGQGDDSTDAYKIYLNFDKNVADDIGMHLVINADKFGSDDALEAAHIAFSNVGGAPMTLLAGKVEVPWGMDYSKFITSTYVHELEIDKVWGGAMVYGIDGFGSFIFAICEADPTNGTDRKLTGSYAIKVKADKLMDGLAAEASMVKVEKDALNDAQKDDSRISIAAKYAVADATVAAEYVTTTSYACVERDDEMGVMLLGVDYKTGDMLLKASYEAISNDTSGDAEETRMLIGANYNFADGVYASLEYGSSSYEVIDGVSQILLGLTAKF